MVKSVLYTCVAVLAIVTMSACSSSDSDSSKALKPSTTKETSKGFSASAGTSKDVTTKPATCDSLTPDDVNQALGTQTVSVTETTSDSMLVCTYDGESMVIVRYESGIDAASWAAAKQGFSDHGQTIHKLLGAGDDAFTSTIGTGQHMTNTAAARLGDMSIQVSASAPLDQVESLLTSLTR